MKQEFTFLSNDQLHHLHAIVWKPERKIKAILQIAHGMQEYIDRYDSFSRYLNDKGIMVVGYDHLGHGKSVNNDEEYGYFTNNHPSDTLTADMYKFFHHIIKDYPNIPYFILGHSMGSYLLRKYLSTYDEPLNGAIIMGTGYISPALSRFAITLNEIFIKIFKSHHRSRFVTALSFGKSYQKFDTNGKKPGKSWLTRNQEIVKKYYQDPMCNYVFTLNGYKGLFETVYFDSIQTNTNRTNKDLPILIISGANDPVGNLGTGVKKVYGMYQITGIKDLTCKLYEDYRHEILNEIDHEIVFDDIYEWMKERL